jgi:hypothetical protein
MNKIKKNKISITVFDKNRGDNYDTLFDTQIMTCRIFHKSDLIDTICISFDKWDLLNLNDGDISDYDAWQMLKKHRLSAN